MIAIKKNEIEQKLSIRIYCMCVWSVLFAWIHWMGVIWDVCAGVCVCLFVSSVTIPCNDKTMVVKITNHIFDHKSFFSHPGGIHIYGDKFPHTQTMSLNFQWWNNPNGQRKMSRKKILNFWIKFHWWNNEIFWWKKKMTIVNK